jgi:hypothetical protein
MYLYCKRRRKTYSRLEYTLFAAITVTAFLPFGPVSFKFIVVVFSASFARYCTSRPVEGCCNVSFHHFIYSVSFIYRLISKRPLGGGLLKLYTFFAHELLIQTANTCLLLAKLHVCSYTNPPNYVVYPRRYILSQVLKFIRFIDVYVLYRDELQPFIHLHIFDMTYAFRPNQVILRYKINSRSLAVGLSMWFF